MMTLDETMIINNMTNVIKNLEQSKRICDIIDDLNELILTLGGRNHPEQVEHVPERAYASEHDKAATVTPVQTNDKTVMKPAAQPAATQPAAAGQPSESKPVQKQAKAKTVTKAPAPGRGKVECRCGLMVCSAAMARHEKGAKHKEAMTKKEKTEMKQAEGQALGMSDMDLVDIETYMTVMLPRLYKKVRGLGGQAHNNETFGFMKIEGDRDETAGSCCGPENAAGRPAAGRNDVHCAVVAVTVDVFGRAGRSKCGQRLHDGQTNCRVLLWAGKAAGRPAAGRRPRRSLCCSCCHC